MSRHFFVLFFVLCYRPLYQWIIYLLNFSLLEKKVIRMCLIVCVVCLCPLLCYLSPSREGGLEASERSSRSLSPTVPRQRVCHVPHTCIKIAYIYRNILFWRHVYIVIKSQLWPNTVSQREVTSESRRDSKKQRNRKSQREHCLC